MRKLMLITLAIFGFSTAHAADVLIKRMATINKNVNIEGPVYRHGKTTAENYGGKIAKILLEEAHKLAKPYLYQGNPQAYYAFLTLALTVPLHEGALKHFDEVRAIQDYCNDSRALGDGIIGKTAKANYKKYLTSGNSPFLTKCSQSVTGRTFSKKLRRLVVGGSDGSDVGMMQVSARWHDKKFLAKGLYKSVRSTIAYGLNYLMYKEYGKGGFDSIFKEYGTKGCFLNRNNKVDYIKIIRGSWSAYNGGSKAFCRFSDSSDPHSKKDKNFIGDLNKVRSIKNSGSYGYNASMSTKLSATERNAIKEIITNLETGSNRTQAMKNLLRRNY